MDEDLHVGRIIGWSIGGVVALFVIGLVINLMGLGFGFAWLPFYRFGAQLSFTQNTIKTVYDPQRCIDINAQFQTFKTQVPAIRDEQIPTAETALNSYEAKLPKDQTTWSPQEQQVDGELQTNVTGLQQELSQLQAQYAAFIARQDTQPCLGSLPMFINLQ
jgi:hypothetical protein